MFLKSKVRSSKAAVLAALAVTCGLSLLIPRPHSLAQSPLRDRIAEVIDDSQVVVLKGNVSPLAKARYDQGEVAADLPMHHMTMMFKLTESQQAALNTLLQQQQDSGSPQYHRWLTPEQYADRFGLTVDDISKIGAWLEGEGFTIDQTARSRTWIAFTGSAAQVETAFHTEIHRYANNGETHYANATEPSVPAALAGVVLSLRSLDDFRPVPPRPIRRRIGGSPKPDYTNGAGEFFLAPSDFATIYDLNSLYSSGVNGTGVSIAIVGQSDISLSDIEAFRKASNLAANDPKVLLVPGSSDPGTVISAEQEADLDLEWSGAVAPNASIIYVNSTNAISISLQYAIDQNLASVVSVSLGACEPEVGLADADALQSLGMEANAQGMTVLAASGDTGAAGCDTTTEADADMGLAVSLPASLPSVTAVGGTEFNEGSGTYWSSGGSALSYIPEIAWNDTASQHLLEASGGGASIFFTKPIWQAGPGVPADGARDVPDVALNASPFHDGYLICSGGDCVNGYVSSNSTIQIAGGTSASTPSFAGIVALVDQATGSAQGNINPTLYKLGESSGAFHNITTGNNMVPCVAGSPDCPSSGMLGYSAGPGYSEVTGLGSVDGAKFVATFRATPSFTVGISQTSLAIGYGTSGTASVSVAAIDGFTGTVKLTCSVASTLGSTSCSLNPTSVGAGGSATLTVTAPAGGSSSPVLTGDVTVNGASGNLSSSAEIPATVAPPSFTLAVSPTLLTVAYGSSGTATTSITANYGFTGTVQLSCSVASTLGSTSCSLSPSSVTTSGSATLTVTAPAASATVPGPAGFGGFGWWSGVGLILSCGLFSLLFRRLPAHGLRALQGAGDWARYTLLFALLLGCLMASTSCGGGSSSSSGPPPPPVLTGDVTVQAVSGSLSASVQLAVTVN